MNALVLALSLLPASIGGCPGGRCAARVYYAPVAPVVVAAPPVVVVAPAYVAPAPPVHIAPTPVPLAPVVPLPAGCRYIWNGYTWVVACY